MLGVTDHLAGEHLFTDGPRVTHVHDGDAGLVQAVDDRLRWHANGTDEQGRLFLDNDGDKVVEGALGVVIVGLSGRLRQRGQQEIHAEGCHLSVSDHVAGQHGMHSRRSGEASFSLISRMALRKNLGLSQGQSTRVCLDEA